MEAQYIEIAWKVGLGIVFLFIFLHFGAVCIHWRRHCRANGKMPYFTYWYRFWVNPGKELKDEKRN
jgi:hypothetical protein